jgi:hypothetical protein
MPEAIVGLFDDGTEDRGELLYVENRRHAVPSSAR